MLIRKVGQNGFASYHFMTVVKTAYLLYKPINWVEPTLVIFLWALWGFFEEHLEHVEAFLMKTTWENLSEKYEIYASTLFVRVTHFYNKLVNCNIY